MNNSKLAEVTDGAQPGTMYIKIELYLSHVHVYIFLSKCCLLYCKASWCHESSYSSSHSALNYISLKNLIASARFSPEYLPPSPDCFENVELTLAQHQPSYQPPSTNNTQIMS